MKQKSIPSIMRTLGDESGAVALLMSLLISMLLFGLGMSASTSTAFEMEIAANGERTTLAFYAAQTGLERAIDGFRTNYTTANLPANGAIVFNQAAVSYPGSTVSADYTVTLQRRDSIGSSPLYPYPIHYTISSTGRQVPANATVQPSTVTLTQTLSVTPRSLANYALFYDDFSSTLSFSPFFRLAGRLAVNEPGGVTVSATTTVNGDFYAAGNIIGGPPIVSGDIVENGGTIPFPTTVSPFSSGAIPGYTYNGTTRLVFFPDGTVTIYNSAIAGGSQNVALPPNGIISVNGDMIVEGTVKGRVTATSTDDIIINGNIRYADQSASSWDALALVAQDSILIPRVQYTATTGLTSFEPIWNGTGTSITGISGGTFGSTPIPPSGSDLYVDATLVGLGATSNGIVDPNNRPPGKFYLYGNTIGKKAVQTIRTSSGVHVNGLSLQITENKKLDLLPPPGFPTDNKVLPTFLAFREVRSTL